MGRCVHRDAIISFEGDSCPICPILDDHVKDKDALRTQLAAAEEVLWYQHCVIECASSATSCGSCGQCSAVKEAKQKFESYRNTYGKGE